MKVLIAIIAILISAILGPCWSGYVTCIMWSWYIVPLFHLPALSIPYAIGLSLMASCLSLQYTKPNDSDDDSFGDILGKLLVGTFGRPALILALGWIVSHWL